MVAYEEPVLAAQLIIYDELIGVGINKFSTTYMGQHKTFPNKTTTIICLTANFR